jgi:hypothetical protein
MATDQKVSLIKTFHSFGSSCVVEVQSQEFSVHDAPLRHIIYQIIKQSKETGSVCDKHAKGHKCSASVRTEETVTEAWKAIIRSPRKSVQCLVQQIEVINYN